MSHVSIVIGAQWGDEGKGKWIDILAKDAEYVARFQGGNNAGHTLYIDGKKIVLHQIPSGIFHEGQICALTAGVVINPEQMVSEIKEVTQFCEVTPKNLWLSARAHVITPWSIQLDQTNEKNTTTPIGTTKRGIGPTYSLKAQRSGLRMGNYIDTASRKQWIKRQIAESEEFKSFYNSHQDLWTQFEAAAEKVAPYVLDADAKLREAIQSEKRLLLEGAQGALLDIDHGTYPFVTSSSTAAGGALSSLGFSPKKIGNIYGVAKAYLTRVGEGPFPTELDDEDGKLLASKGHEFGATTGRPRRCGWLDIVALRYAVQVNGLDHLILNKFDILGGFKEVKLAVAYEHPTLGRIENFPWDIDTLNSCKPIYQSFEGWPEDIPISGSMSELPKQALTYIANIEELVGAKVSMVGTGVNRSDALYR